MPGSGRLTRRLISTGSPYEQDFGYSRAVVQGSWCFVSGVTGYDYTTMKMAEGVAAQARNCFLTLHKVLDEAGFSLSETVRVQYAVVSRDLIPALGPVLGEAFGDIRPAATMIVADLIEPEMLIEIEITAFKG